MAAPLLAIEGLTLSLPAGAEREVAVRDVDLAARRGETLCVVGESGSGKSLTALAVMGLLPHGVRVAAGRIRLDGTDLLALPAGARRALNGRHIGMIFQEPMSALNPTMRIGRQIAEVAEVHGGRGTGARRVEALLEAVRLPDAAALADAFPHELSGGQRQRAMIAMAIALDPGLLLADEPTTALDVTTQAGILVLLKELQRERGMGLVLITHDFGVVADMADRVAVMERGRIVEDGPAARVLSRPAAPYTRRLLEAVPSLEPPARPAVPAATGPAGAALAIDGLVKRYRGGRRGMVDAVAGVDLTVAPGEALALVGESGSGKSTLARAAMRLIEPDAGRITLAGRRFDDLRGDALRRARRDIQIVFQDPYGSLNPRATVGRLIAQGPINFGMSRAAAAARAREMLALVGLDAAAAARRPQAFSGGQRQRIGLARALALEPRVLVADEPVSALDVSVQAMILDLIDRIRRERGLALLFITHDLRVAARIADRVAVMRAGRIVEQAPAAALFHAPRDPYTKALLEAVPGRDRTGLPARP